jgi:eukaryotic-like serine/threonine-protein kinase
VLSIDDAVFYTRQIAEALHHASGRGVVHRDVKPSNILVSNDGDTKLVDMGLARSDQLDMSGDMTASGVTLGTFDYISPEQARDPRDADVRSDIYSLGCTLYFMLTGRPPYPGGTMLQKLLNHGNAPPPDPAGFREDVSDDLTAIIHKMLAKSPDARYQRAIDLVADLRELAMREGLPRAQSQGTLTISRDDLADGGLVTHLPWLAAAALLLLGAVILQIIASLRGDTFIIEHPATATTLRPMADGNPAAFATLDPSGEPSLRPGTTAAPGTAAEDFDDSDPAAQPPPPYSEDIAKLRDRPAGTVPAVPRETALPVRIDKIIVGQSVAPENALVVATLFDALQLAAERGVNDIEIAERLIESEPVRIPRDRMTIRSSVGSSEIRFHTGPTSPMQRPVMIDVGANQIELQDLDLAWSVGSASREGGTLIALTDNRGVRLTRCTISIENVTERGEVYAFEVTSPPQGRGNGGLLPTDPLQLRVGADLNGPLREGDLLPGAERASLSQRLGPPLVAIRLNNVAARGEMTLINLADAARLELKWDNGLLAVSRRMLEVAGNKLPPSGAGNRVRLELNYVTAFTGEGLVRTRLGPSGSYPMLIDRDSRKAVFRSPVSAPHVEFTGLPEGYDDPEQLVKLRGGDNAYDFVSDSDPQPLDDWPLLSLTMESGEQQSFGISQMTASRPAWADDGIEALAQWSKPLDPTLPAHRMMPADFFQDGTIVSGFDSTTLPSFPVRMTAPLEVTGGPTDGSS